jgi:salicylate synthase
MYAERSVSFAADALAVATALSAHTTQPYFLYENRGVVSWAEGERSVLEVYADRAVLVTGERRREHPVTAHPLAAAGAVLADVVSPRDRTYGWITFELAGHADWAGTAPLARFVLPRKEIRFIDGVALLRAETPNEVDELEAALAEAITSPHHVPESDPYTLDVSEHDAERYKATVASAVRDIRDGRLDKVILSRSVPVHGDVDLPATYLAGRRGNDPARSFLVKSGDWEVAGFSPEIVTRVDADGVVLTQPLAGTRALDGDLVMDVARREELYRDAKEVFEHAISVRLAAAELATVCAPGSVRVEDFMSIKERGSVQHLASELAGDLRPGVSCWDALAALFPAVTASGIPKAQACEVIRAVEPDRGLYGGAVLTVDADGTLDAALVLRSIYRQGTRTWLRAGAGIVAQSVPERELEETREKFNSVARFVVPALSPATV